MMMMRMMMMMMMMIGDGRKIIFNMQVTAPHGDTLNSRATHTHTHTHTECSPLLGIQQVVFSRALTIQRVFWRFIPSKCQYKVYRRHWRLCWMLCFRETPWRRSKWRPVPAERFWSILVLRFSSTTGQHGNTTQSASFRKKNPAQITRDWRRVEAFQQQQQQQRHTLQQHQASAVDIQDETAEIFVYIPDLSISDVNTSCRRPATSREVSERPSQQPPIHTASKQAHVQREQQRRPTHS